MSAMEAATENLRQSPRTWLVTGVAGFIGSNLLERLLQLDQRVVGLDNFFSGSPRNLAEVKSSVGPGKWERFAFTEGDVRDPKTCLEACRSVDYVLHQAGFCSVPGSIDEPALCNEVNVCGTVNMLTAARDLGVERFVYASSSSVYGDSPALPQKEEVIGRPLSPYSVTKRTGELYAAAFAATCGLEAVGLRYFNVFGPRQDAGGAYGAVIPAWISAMIRGEPCFINGTGETSRDFCYVENAVQANLLAATTGNAQAVNRVYNVAFGESTSLNELFQLLRDRLSRGNARLEGYRPVHRDFRPGDIMHSVADIGRARELLGYEPTHDVAAGLDAALEWYTRNLP